MWLFNKKKDDGESLRTIGKLVEYIQEARKSNYDDKKIFDFFWKNKYPEQIVKNAFTIADYERQKGGNKEMRFGKKEPVLEEAETTEEQEFASSEDDEQDLPEQPKAKPIQKQRVQVADKFSVFHLPERTGIVNNETKVPVGEDVLTILAVILNKVDKIENSVG